MALAPITLFTRTADLAAVARHLRERVSALELDGPDDGWQHALVTFGEGKQKQTLQFNYDPNYHAEPNWSAQMNGMRGYFAQFPNTERKPLALALTTTFRLSLGTLFSPDYDPEGDPRLGLLFEVAELLDGVLFTPSSLRDAEGRILVSQDGEDEEDPDAVWPRVLGNVSIDATTPEEDDDEDEDDEEPIPPTPEQVARRALALTAVTFRALLEPDAAEDYAAETHAKLLAWVDESGIDDAFEDQERKLVRRKPGRLAQRDQVNSSWRLEGLAVLAWALNRLELPPHDQLVDPSTVWEALGLLDAETTRALLAAPNLRPTDELAQRSEQIFAIHWRLRNYSLKPGPMDFVEFARTCWFGPLDLTDLSLVDGDLALGGDPLDRAPEEIRARTYSSAQERHQAINWLLEGPVDEYSEASVDT